MPASHSDASQAAGSPQSEAGVAGLLFALRPAVGRLVGCRPLSSSVSSIDRQPESDGSWLDEKGEPCPDVAVSSISQVDQAAIYASQLPTSV